MHSRKAVYRREICTSLTGTRNAETILRTPLVAKNGEVIAPPATGSTGRHILFRK
jgi:hypothetical protein